VHEEYENNKQGKEAKEAVCTILSNNLKRNVDLRKFSFGYLDDYSLDMIRKIFSSLNSSYLTELELTLHTKGNLSGPAVQEIGYRIEDVYIEGQIECGSKMYLFLKLEMRVWD